MDQEATRSEFDALSEDFFTQPSLAPVEIGARGADGTWDDEPALLPAGSRRAMHVTLGLLGASFVGLGAFLFYTHVVMPSPEELGAAGAALPMAIPDVLETVPAAMPRVADKVALDGQVILAATVAPEVASTTVVALVPEPPATTLDAAPQAAAQLPPRAVREGRHRSTRVDPLATAYRSLNRGDARDALARANRVTRSAPTRADAWLVVGAAYAALHDRSSAQAAFRSCARNAIGPHVSECRQLARD